MKRNQNSLILAFEITPFTCNSMYVYKKSKIRVFKPWITKQCNDISGFIIQLFKQFNRRNNICPRWIPNKASLLSTNSLCHFHNLFISDWINIISVFIIPMCRYDPITTTFHLVNWGCHLPCWKDGTFSWLYSNCLNLAINRFKVLSYTHESWSCSNSSDKPSQIPL